MRALAWIIATTLLVSLADESVAGRRVTVTREAIRALGATRLHDLIAVTEPWNPQSNDGYTVSPTPRALSLPRAAQWAVFLNGQRLDVTVFDAVHLEMVPVSLAEIDSVVFCDESGPGTSWDSGRGRVEIFAARARGGWNAGGAVSAANESGDPGPWRYTDRTTPNVDGIGPDGSLWVSCGASRWYAALSASLAQHPYTDNAMRERTVTALRTYRPGATTPASDATAWFYDPTWPAVLRTSASLRAGVRAGSRWQEALVSVQDARRYFHYSEPFGRELPTDQRVTTFALSGRAGLAANLSLGYHASASESQLSDQDGVLAFDYDWETRRARGDVDLARAGRDSRVVLFAGIEERRAATTDSLSRDEDTFVRAGLTAERRLGARWRVGLDAAGTFSNGDAAASLGATANWTVRQADTLRARVRVAQRLFVEDDNLWLWSERGYDLLARNGVSYTIDGPVTNTTVSSADLGWTSRGMLGGVDVDLGVRRFDDAYVEQRAFAFDPTTCAFVSPTRVTTGRTGHVALVRTRLWHGLGSNSWADFSWTYHEEFNSDDAFGALGGPSPGTA
ncbi:MAG TPA: hypothetical protein VFT13_10550 [Candidatus Krumholzibacteria bacterium]|nr:hypothetical protein [Candidatus Krumholzibacteria bacterium]